MRPFCTLLALIWALAAAGAAAAAAPMTVVATTTQMQDLVRNVGGGHVRVVGLLRPNVDPHEYEPTPGDASATSNAKLIVVSGVGLDSWMDKLIRGVGSKATVVDASEGIRLRRGDPREPQGDPHWWHDPTNFEHAALTLAARLERIDPDNRRAYAAAAKRYVRAIAAMDAANKRLLAQVPLAKRKLVTNHDAFGYLAAHYEITIVGSVIPSLSTAAEPNARDTARLIERIKAEHVKAIFTESSINPKLEEQIAREAHVKVFANLYGDTLGPKGSPGASYIGTERWNIRALFAGFLGK